MNIYNKMQYGWRIFLMFTGFSLFFTNAWAIPANYQPFIHQRPDNQKSWHIKWCERFSLCDRSDFDRSIAMVIGVADYEFLKKLKYTKNNPGEMKDYFLNEAGFDEVIYLTEEDATRETVNWFMENYIPQQFEGEKYSRFVFYFSGHGQARWPNAEKPAGYLRLKMDKSDRWDQSIPMSDVSRWAQQNLSAVRHRLFLVDSCFSGLTGFEFMNTGQSELDPSRTPEDLIKNTASVIITAGEGDQPTLSTQLHGGSVFTRALLTGLQGKADKIEDGVITSEELFQWVQGAVKNVAENHSRQQIPTIYRLKNTRLISNRGPFFFQNPKRRFQARAIQNRSGDDEDMGAQNLSRLTVNTVPKTAKVKVLGESEYFPAMALAPGNYQVEVSAFNFKTKKQWVAVVEDHTEVSIELKSAERPIVNVFQDPLKNGGLGPLMVIIPAGSFQMGDLSGAGFENEKPVHAVTIANNFTMSQTEITFADYERFIIGSQHRIPEDKNWGRGNRPVIDVSWHDANAYTKWLSEQTGKSYRLPSEAEWEYGARAGSKTDYPWGDNADYAYANYSKYGSLDGHVEGNDKWIYTAPVGKFAANDFGLQDMQGNVAEWVQDCWHDSYESAPDDGSPWMRGYCNKAVVRGGSWGDAPQFLRSSWRRWNPRTKRFNHIGFRVVRD